MDTLHLVDPALRPMLEVWPTFDLTPELLTVMRQRELPQMPIEPSGISVEERQVPGPEGAPEVGLRIYRPESRPESDARLFGCIYHIHGGGYVGGSAKEIEFLIRPLAGKLGCVVVSVDYRLAPEAVFPAAIEDCYAGLAWTFAHADALGVDRTRIGVMGESAGGGLAAALALMARDRGEYPLKFQCLTYPMIDDRTATRDPHPTAGQFVWTGASNHFGWASLLGHEPGVEGVSPYAAAARAEDLAGLPATFILTGGLDLFVDEDFDYARRLNAAGVATEFHVYPGAFHGFDFMAGVPVADQAHADRSGFLKRVLG